MVPGPCDDGSKHLDRLGDTAPEVLLGEGLGGAAEDGDRLHLRRQGPVKAALIGDEHRTTGTDTFLAQLGKELRGIRQLGNPGRVDEGGDLDRLQAGGSEPADELRLDLGRDGNLFVLQAVACPDLIDRDPCGQGRIGHDVGPAHRHHSILTRDPLHVE